MNHLAKKTPQDGALLSFRQAKGQTPLLLAHRQNDRSWKLLYNESSRNAIPLYAQTLMQIASLSDLKKRCATLDDAMPEYPVNEQYPLHQIICYEVAQQKEPLISLHSSDAYPQKLILTAKDRNAGIAALKGLSRALAQFRPVAIDFGAVYAVGGDEGYLRQFHDREMFLKHFGRLCTVVEKLNQEKQVTQNTPSSPLYLLAKQIHKDLKRIPFKHEVFHLFKHAALGEKVDKSPYGTRLRAQCSPETYPESQVVAYIDAFMKGKNELLKTMTWPVDVKHISEHEWSIMEQDLFRGVNHRMCVPSKEAWIKANLMPTANFHTEQQHSMIRFIHANCEVSVNNRLGLMAFKIINESLSGTVESRLKKTFLMA